MGIYLPDNGTAAVNDGVVPVRQSQRANTAYAGPEEIGGEKAGREFNMAIT